jgi:beta-xylosidase
MLYTAYCFDGCKREKGVYLLAATSTNGRDWVKREKPVISKIDVKMAKDGAAEAELVKAPDGFYYLFMSLLHGDAGHDIGVARSRSPFGPWEFAPDAIVKRSPGQFDDIGPIAPSVLIENDTVRLWYHGFSKRKTIQIGYAEARWPLKAP